MRTFLSCRGSGANHPRRYFNAAVAIINRAVALWPNTVGAARCSAVARDAAGNYHHRAASARSENHPADCRHRGRGRVVHRQAHGKESELARVRQRILGCGCGVGSRTDHSAECAACAACTNFGAGCSWCWKRRTAIQHSAAIRRHQRVGPSSIPTATNAPAGDAVGLHAETVASTAGGTRCVRYAGTVRER